MKLCANALNLRGSEPGSPQLTPLLGPGAGTPGAHARGAPRLPKPTGSQAARLVYGAAFSG
eukprot:10843167-Alexandrium_andersonii.AAC.1